MPPKVDLTGALIISEPDGMTRLDGVPMFRKVVRDGVIYLQFFDHDRMRSNCRGTRFVEVPLDVLNSAINPTTGE